MQCHTPSLTNILLLFCPLSNSSLSLSLCTLPTLPCPVSGCSMPPTSFSSPDSLRVLQWNARGRRVRSAELLHFISLHLVHPVCMQESNLNWSFFRIPGYCALQLNRTNSWSSILSPDDHHASGNVIIFVRLGLFFSELFISSFSLCLTPTLTV